MASSTEVLRRSPPSLALHVPHRPRASLALLACLLALACRSYRASEPDPRAPRSADPFDAAGRLFVDEISPESPGTIDVVDLARGVEVGTFDDHSEPDHRRLAVAVAPSGRLVASLRSQIRFQPAIDPTTGALVETIPRQAELLVWDPATRAIVGRIAHDDADPITGFAFSADEQSLMVATSQGLERVGFDGRRLAAWAIPGLRVFTAMPNRPGAWLLAVETAKRPYFARLDESRRRPRTLRLRGTSGVTRMRVSPDGRWLAVGAWHGGLELWDLTARRAPALRTEDWVNDLAFSADSRTLAASVGLPCGPPMRVVAWDLATTRELLDLKLEAHSVHIRGRELIVGRTTSVDRIDLATGNMTPVVAHECQYCDVRICA